MWKYEKLFLQNIDFLEFERKYSFKHISIYLIQGGKKVFILMNQRSVSYICDLPGVCINYCLGENSSGVCYNIL